VFILWLLREMDRSETGTGPGATGKRGRPLPGGITVTRALGQGDGGAAGHRCLAANRAELFCIHAQGKCYVR